jgi:hypothetical protein
VTIAYVHNNNNLQCYTIIAEGEEKPKLHALPTFSEIGVDLREPLLELESESESQIRAATY